MALKCHHPQKPYLILTALSSYAAMATLALLAAALIYYCMLQKVRGCWDSSPYPSNSKKVKLY